MVTHSTGGQLGGGRGHRSPPPGPCRRHQAAGPPYEAALGQMWGAQGRCRKEGRPQEHPGVRCTLGPGRERRRGRPPGEPHGGSPGRSAQTPPSLSACRFPTREGWEAGPCRLCPQVLGTGPGRALGAPRVSTFQDAHGGLSRVMREALAFWPLAQQSDEGSAGLLPSGSARTLPPKALG